MDIKPKILKPLINREKGFIPMKNNGFKKALENHKK